MYIYAYTYIFIFKYLSLNRHANFRSNIQEAINYGFLWEIRKLSGGSQYILLYALLYGVDYFLP